MTTKSTRHEAPIVPLNSNEGTKFSLTPEQIVLLRNGSLAFRDFRHLSIESMRAMHSNNRILSRLIEEELLPEEELQANINNLLYGPPGEKLDIQERERKREELTEMNKAYKKKKFSVVLHTVPAEEFQKALEDPEANFPKRDFQRIGQVDSLVAYFDLLAEGLITDRS